MNVSCNLVDSNTWKELKTLQKCSTGLVNYLFEILENFFSNFLLINILHWP